MGTFVCSRLNLKSFALLERAYIRKTPLYFGTIHDGNPAKALANGLFLTKAAGSAAGCAVLATWVGPKPEETVIFQYQFPEPLFITS